MSVELLEKYDRYAAMRNAIREIAQDRDEWAGIPLPLEGQPLVIEPTYPRAELLMQCGRKEEPEPKPEHIKLRNSFWSSLRRSEVIIASEHGKVRWGIEYGGHHFDLDLQTLGASVAWGLEQEANAIQLLATLLKHHPFKQYLLTGMFIETSRRSGVSYVFRKLRPTIAIGHTPEGGLKILCAMCLHPIGYYSGSWAGAMCATDDVIAHLMLMRGDEHLFWRRANQHPAWRPEAGL